MIVWMRHGESTWNATGRFQGSTAHPPLTDRGRAQVESVVPQLADLGLTQVITSPAVRAHQSATLVADALDLPLTVDDRLVEQGAGETISAVVARVKRFLADRDVSEHPLVVSHGDTIVVAYFHLTGDDVPGPLGNASLVTTP